MTETRLDDFKFRMQLTALAILQFIFIMCTFWFGQGGFGGYVIFRALEGLAGVAIMFVTMAIFCKWKPGIYVFVFSSFVLFILSAGSFIALFVMDDKNSGNASKKMFQNKDVSFDSIVLDGVQMLLSGICLGYGIFALIPVKGYSSLSNAA
mmetsp:Transcript_10360/g.14893  ORF Transcript_10360/g.14893 Transcript_10360/m.14893 type:complete len:151 (+) Transcript_10360:103-555(+)|eukprot:CAMPEP_0173056720 /NCGR_PEP_ID=MMETSP1102-20130122/306_1 /TAXON_ID=49646 /ORGANISM="Geminigera sp., Strain Caron Lab Isolate" /LENGTH=150 /DNA_ID=CAMNT_0013922085 /DNA_START=79 /DNA_END=531 /DNA_ORIENTATION=-